MARLTLELTPYSHLSSGQQAGVAPPRRREVVWEPLTVETGVVGQLGQSLRVDPVEL
jgi:hypothetical protein